MTAPANYTVTVSATEYTCTIGNVSFPTQILGLSQADLSSATPLALGTAAAGTGTTASRADHVHPTTGLMTQASADTRYAPIAHVGSAATSAHSGLGTAAAQDATSFEAANANIQSHVTGTGSPHTPAGIGAYRAQTPAAAINVSGASVAPDFASALTLQWTLTGNVTSFAAAANLADGETGMVLATIGAYALPANPPSGAYKGAWTVTGTLVRIVIERVGSTYLWSADSLAVVA